MSWGGEQRGYDAKSLLHHNHIRSGMHGQWRGELTDRQVAAVESRFGDWLLRHGYRIGSDAPPSRHSVRLFSQKGEDSLLWEFFGYKVDGFFVDVGAFDGVHLSNSLSFELGGWKGVCVEANPEYYRKCQQARPGSVCVNSVCVGDPEIREINFRTEPLGLLSGVEADAEDVAARYADRRLEFEGFTEVMVPAATLTDLLGLHVPQGKSVDFISIDVEGTEVDVLKGLDLERFGPRLLILEANTEEAEREMVEYLEPRGYVVARSLGVNRFFSRPGADAQHLAALSFECVIERNLHPKGEEYTLQSSLSDRVVRERRGGGGKGLAMRLLRRLRRLLAGGHSSDDDIHRPYR